MQQVCSLNFNLLISPCMAPETLAQCFLWQPVGSCCTGVAHSHLFCRLCAARGTSPPVASRAPHACWQTGGDWLKVRGVCFWEDICSPSPLSWRMRETLAECPTLQKYFHNKCYTHGTCPLLKYSSGRGHRPLLLKGFLISHQPALSGVLL